MEEHELKVCVLAESQIINRLTGEDQVGLADELCHQLYMDRLGHGINGINITRRGRK